MLDTEVYKHTLRICNTNCFFSLQQWLHERASLLRYTYSACHVYRGDVLCLLRGASWIFKCNWGWSLLLFWGLDSSVGIATGYGLDGHGMESLGSEIFRTYPYPPWGPPSLLYSGYRVFPGVKSSWGVLLPPHSLLLPWSRKSRAIPLLPLWAVRPVQSLSACTVHLYLYSHYGPYGLYRASVPVQ
jgi:hypothetical protein